MKAMFLKAKRLSLLGGLLVLAHTGAASNPIATFETFGTEWYSGSDWATPANDSITATLHPRTGWGPKSVYYLKMNPFGYTSLPDVDTLLSSYGSEVPRANWSASGAKLTCPTPSSDYSYLVVRHEPYGFGISFAKNSSSASGSMTAMTGLSYTNTVTLSENLFKRTGYSFAGWTLDEANAGAVFANRASVSGSSFGVSSDNQTITLYAKWSPITYKVTCSADGGTFSNGSSSYSESFSYDSTFSVSAPTKTGYTFTGWKVSGHDSSTACYGADSSCGRSVGSTGSISNPDSDTLYFKNLTTTLNGTVTLTAQWTANKTTVSFNTGASDASGGPSSTTIPYGTKAQSMPVSPFSKPTRDGYTFAGYYTAANGGGTKYFDDTGLLVTDWLITDSSITLFAAWTPITYTVTFDKTDGSGTTPSSLTKKYDETFELPDGASLTKSGYKFAGWALTSGGSAVQQAGNEVTVSQYKSWLSGTTLTFYAAWALNTKTVYFSANGGSVSPGSVTVEIGQAIGDLPTPTYSGGKKIFAGWFTAASGGTQVTATTVVTSDLSTLYAHWKNATYTIRFNGNDNTSGSMDDQTVEFNVSTALSQNNFSRIGYTFAGWAMTADATSYEYADKASVRDLASPANATVDLYAVWTANKTTVSFNTGASDASGGPSSTTIPYGTKAQSMPVSPFSKPTRDGYTFAGYYTAANGGGTKYFDDTGLLVTDWLITDSSITLFAAWTPITYTVTFDKTDGSGTTPSSLTKKYDETFELPDGASLTKSGYKFAGWALTSGGSAVQQAGNEVTVSQYKSWLSGTTLTFYAAWALNTKTVYFSANGGSVSPGSVTVEIGQAIGDLPTPTYSGGKKIFAGWFTAASGGTQVTATTVVTSDLSTLYAHWKNATYTIRFNGNDNTSGSMDDQTVEFSVATNLSANAFQRTGYAFAGWATTATATSTNYADEASITTDLASSANEVVNLYAVWTANTYYVTFAPNGGSGTMATLTNSYDVAFALPSCAFTAPAFSTFGGWLDAANSTTYAAGETVKSLTADDGATVTLTAVWNSALSDLSQAMHCTNLDWTNDVKYQNATNSWTVLTGTGVGHGTDSCVKQTNAKIAMQKKLVASLGVSPRGTLSFWWKPTGSAGTLYYSFKATAGDMDNSPLTLTAAAGVWTNVVWRIDDPLASSTAEVFVNLMNGSNSTADGACLIDGMTWTPGNAEEEHPEPTADDAVTISGLTATDGGFTLSYTGDEKFAYRVLYTDSLATPIVWLPYGSLTNDTGASGSQTFSLDRDASVPMRFFKVETIRRP